MTKRKKARKPVTTPALPWNGDHGTGTQAAIAGTIVVEIEGPNPNRFARRQRVSQIDRLATTLSMRQLQAAREIEEAYCRVQMLSSGGALKEQVDSSPKPDAVVAQQVDAVSRLEFVMRAVPSAMRPVVETVCWHNEPVSSLARGRAGYNHMANLKVALDLVANKLRY